MKYQVLLSWKNKIQFRVLSATISNMFFRVNIHDKFFFLSAVLFSQSVCYQVHCHMMSNLVSRPLISDTVHQDLSTSIVK